jgi:hypothetical protein
VLNDLGQVELNGLDFREVSPGLHTVLTYPTIPGIGAFGGLRSVTVNPSRS